MGKEKERTATSYTVLRKVIFDPEVPAYEELGVCWELVGVVSAANAEDARRHFAELTGEEGEYVAPPTRSFAPLPVALERTPRAVIGRK